jgi:GNAT superfamily N-acetyltransferase
MEWTHGDYHLSDDKQRLDLTVICELLATSYWANDRPRAAMEVAIHHSLCLGLYHDGRQVGFARAVTDHATFTWVCDVIIHPDHRAHGLGKWMVEQLLDHPEIQTRTQLLGTRDAHPLYERFGFERFECMRRRIDYRPEYGTPLPP